METSEFSLGVEEEYQLVDPRTGELRSRARDVLGADWADELHHEVHETMLEVGSRICADSAELGAELRRLRLHVGSVAAAEELTFVAAGLHPFSRWEGQRPTPGDRYARVLQRFGRIMRTEHVFGMHVHVALPARVDRVALIGALRVHLPPLLALSASSPYYEGEDTGFASYRAVLIRRLPHSGVPPRFRSAAEQAAFVEAALAAGALEDRNALYWSLRAHPRFPTLEFRVTDVCPRVDDAVAIAGLIRCLVAGVARGAVRGWGEPANSSVEDAMLDANEWQAARYGLDAGLLDPTAPGGAIQARDAVRRLLEAASPVADALGEGEALRAVERLLERGTAAERVRARGGAEGMQGVVDWLARESQLGVGMDRRAEQREPAAR